MAKKKKVKVPTDLDKYGVISADEALKQEKDYLRLPTPLLWLNDAIGGGFVYGRIHEVFGFESTGKSLLAKAVGQAVQAAGGVIGWADSEMAFDKRWAIKNGLDMEGLYVFEENSVDLVADWMRDFALFWRSKLINNEPILIVVDSLAALDKSDFIGADMEGASAKMGNRAKAIDEMWRTRNKILAKCGIIVIAINQVRNKLGVSMFESNETTPGGNSTKFYSSIRIAVARGKQIKGKVEKGKWKDLTKGPGVRKIGQNVFVSFPKNKTYAPHGNVPTQVYFLDDKTGYVGFDRYSGIDEILVEQGIVEKRGSNFYFKDKRIATSQDNFLQEFSENAKLRKRLLRRAEIPTVSQFISKLESINENRYPVEYAVD